jgi:hypothetical protein
MTAPVIRHVFALEVGGKLTLAFEAQNLILLRAQLYRSSISAARFDYIRKITERPVAPPRCHQFLPDRSLQTRPRHPSACAACNP